MQLRSLLRPAAFPFMRLRLARPAPRRSALFQTRGQSRQRSTKARRASWTFDMWERQGTLWSCSFTARGRWASLSQKSRRSHLYSRSKSWWT